MLILFDRDRKKWRTCRIIWYKSGKYFSYAFKRALNHHKFMIGLIHYGGGGHPIQNPPGETRCVSAIGIANQRILVAFSGKVARES